MGKLLKILDRVNLDILGFSQAKTPMTPTIRRFLVIPFTKYMTSYGLGESPKRAFKQQTSYLSQAAWKSFSDSIFWNFIFWWKILHYIILYLTRSCDIFASRPMLCQRFPDYFGGWTWSACNARVE